jgi:hypothetical protein
MNVQGFGLYKRAVDRARAAYASDWTSRHDGFLYGGVCGLRLTRTSRGCARSGAVVGMYCRVQRSIPSAFYVHLVPGTIFWPTISFIRVGTPALAGRSELDICVGGDPRRSAKISRCIPHADISNPGASEVVRLRIARIAFSPFRDP